MATSKTAHSSNQTSQNGWTDLPFESVRNSEPISPTPLSGSAIPFLYTEDGVRHGQVLLFAAGFAFGAGSSTAPERLRVRHLELINEVGDVVGRFASTEQGAELVVGGRAQVSLVTEGPLAAVNVVGEPGVARLVAADAGYLVTMPPDAPALGHQPVPSPSPR